MKSKIEKAIQTMSLQTNYGGLLQAFALQYYFENKGAEVRFHTWRKAPDVQCAQFYVDLQSLAFKAMMQRHCLLPPG
ncbi:MAG: hypothetical protein ACOYCD_08120 [Kiritimatiellia bacterium]|jgi:hypothetical protein